MRGRFHGMADETIKTGIEELDAILSGGLRRPGDLSRFLAAAGPETTIKSTYLIELARKAGKTAVSFDLEMSLDPKLTEQLLGRRKRDEPDDPDDPITPKPGS